MSIFDPVKYKEIERSAYSTVADTYLKYGGAIFEALASPLLEAAKLQPGQHVLDVACGVGIPSLTAARLLTSAGSVIGIDLAPGMLELARSRAEDMGLNNISFQEADAEHLPFPDDSFDVVLCHLGLIHFTDRMRALQEMKRVLKFEGRLVLSVWSTPDRTAVIGIVAATIREVFPAAIVPGAPMWFDFGVKGSIESLLDQIGFREIETNKFDYPLVVKNTEEYWQTNLGVSGRLQMLLQNVPSEIATKIEMQAKDRSNRWRDGSVLRIPCEEIVVSALR
ncbi:MAG: class I SAM-dependent methyltransferase [Desulfomonilaceae bacterium]